MPQRLLRNLADSTPELLVRAGIVVALSVLTFALAHSAGSDEETANAAAVLVTLGAVLAQIVVAFEPPPTAEEHRLRPNALTAALGRAWDGREDTAATVQDRLTGARLLLRPGADAAGRQQVLALVARARTEVLWATSDSVTAATWTGSSAERLRTALVRAVVRGVRVRCLVLPDAVAAADLFGPVVPRPEVRRLTDAQSPDAAELLDHACLVVDGTAYGELGAGGQLLLSTREADVRRGREVFEARWEPAAEG